MWNWIRDYIQDKYGLVEKPTPDQLRLWAKEAWDAVPDYFLEDLLPSMPVRCQPVLDQPVIDATCDGLPLAALLPQQEDL